jgi:hypothetical protein
MHGKTVTLSRVYPTLDHALVHCPACDGRATVYQGEDGIRLACPACGHSRTAPWSRRHYESGPTGPCLENYDSGHLPFDARLWLETECCGGERLWAINESHLDYLASYISETQRERQAPSPAGKRGLGYRLPTWMKLAKNRDEVLRSIERLRATL